MVYFQHCETAAEVRKTYRTLAKKFHPDLGGDEEKMKRLTTEYEEALRALPTKKTKVCDVIEMVEERLHDLGVTTPHSVYCGKTVEITLERGVDPSQVLIIEADIRRELERSGFLLLIKYWGERESRPYEIFTGGCVTFIDIDAGNTYLHYAKQTRNYEQALYRTLAAYVADTKNGEKWYNAYWDSKLKHGYLMHCSRTLTLPDLLTIS